MRLFSSNSGIATCVIAAWVGLSIGCSPSDEATITGKVSFKGEPVVQGAITYENVDGSGQSHGCEIKDGVYQADNVKFGTKIVKIRAVKVVGREKKYPDLPDSPVTEIYESIIPVKYNDLSELRLDVNQATIEENYDLNP